MCGFEFIVYSLFAVGMAYNCDGCCGLVFVAIEGEYVFWVYGDIFFCFLHLFLPLIIILSISTLIVWLVIIICSTMNNFGISLFEQPEHFIAVYLGMHRFREVFL